jgi:hypothetical protein
MISIYIGCPGSGKTTRALADARARARARGVPLAVIDPARTPTLESVRHYARLEDWIRALWAPGARAPVEAAHALEEEDAPRFFRACAAAGRLVLLIDESRWYASAHAMPQELRRLIRAHRAFELDLLVTTQHYADLAQEVWACADRLIVFRTMAPRALERLRAEYGLDPEVLRHLGRGESVTLDLGLAG